MCGIVAGVSSHKNVIDALLTGLERLEYRGYDSCGVAFLQPPQGDEQAQTLQRLRTTARVHDLIKQVDEQHIHATIGIAHTRWATHGKPSTDNAHPHFSNDTLAVVHNGIIENHDILRKRLLQKGYVFSSQTDTEVIAHLIFDYYQQQSHPDLLQAVRLASLELEGAYAIAAFTKKEPDVIVGAKVASPLVLAIGEGEHFLVSDTLAIAGRCQQAIYLEEGELVKITPTGYQIIHQKMTDTEIDDANSNSNTNSICDSTAATTQPRTMHNINEVIDQVDLGPYSHYMQKEIFEQPSAISNTLGDLQQFSTKLFGKDAWELFAKTKQILILACGTSYYAGCVAKYWLELLAGIPTQVEIASEYRYRTSVANPEQLILTISQSGETADTLSALAHAKAQGHTLTLSICNVATSAMVRATALHFLTKAGVEIGVASTKAFTTQLVALAILSYTFAKQRGKLSEQAEAAAIKDLRHLPNGVQKILALEPAFIAWSQQFATKAHALFLGRGMHYPIAMEGALKMKEISYIHAEAYAAGELKHGPLALVTEAMPVVVVAPKNDLLEKLKSNIEEVRARGGELFVLMEQNTLDDLSEEHIQHAQHVHVIYLPEYIGVLSPILHSVALQLLAYHTACLRGNDVDKPRNLAKSVTVE